MIDIHSHIIHDLDDGPSRIDETVKMICEAEKLGIKVIIATPHYHEGVFTMEKVFEKYNEVLSRANEYNITIKLGSEVFLSSGVCIRICEDATLTLNRSRYSLIELPLSTMPEYNLDAIYKLQANGIIPIIAHPERNRNFIRNPESLEAYTERGCLLQMDIGSIAGAYGGGVRDFAKRLIRLKMVDFIASDAHCSADYTEWYKKAYLRTNKWAGEEYTERLFFRNAASIVKNADRSIYRVI